MRDVQYVIDEDIRVIVEQDCQFDIEDHGIGYYEHGNGKYTDKNLQLSLTTQEIVVQYPIDPESMIFTMVTGTYYLTDGDGMDFECDYMAELSQIEYNSETKMFDATYEVNEG
jgi:hypothetical protein